MKSEVSFQTQLFSAKQESVSENTTEHTHDHIEIFRVTDGFIRLYLNSTLSTYDVFKGDCVVICNCDSHAVYPAGKTSVESVSIPLSFVTSLGSTFIRSSFIIPRSIIEEKDTTKALLNSLFASLLDTDTGNSICSEGLTKSLCASLCAVLFDLYGMRRTVSSISATFFKLKSKSIVSGETLAKFEKIRSYIEQNYTDSRINLTELSKISGLNKNFLSSLFPKILGKHYIEYIHELRISKAIELMYQSDKNVQEIAYLCGFETVQTFYNTFKSLCHTNPSAFLSGIRSEEQQLAQPELTAVGEKIFDYSWYTDHDGLRLERLTDSNCLHIICTNRYSQIWSHLKLRFYFFPAKTYKISYTAKALENSIGTSAQSKILHCCFTFKDSHTKNNFHIAAVTKTALLDDGWVYHEADYTVPDYYKPSVLDCFSIYADPLEGVGISYLVKDICIKKM